METFPDEVILEIRTSQTFRNSVIFVNIVSLVALVVTVIAIQKLYKTQIFTSSTTILLIFDIALINIHNVSYVFLQNWSLYRSFFSYRNQTEIMFQSEECWPHHVTNEYTKTVTLFVQFALILNRISVTIKPQNYSKNRYGILLSILTLAASGVFTAQQHYRGPLRGMRTTSCFRESDVVLDLKTEHIVPYISICSASIFLSFSLMFYVKRQSKKKTYNIMSEYMRKESVISTVAVIIIGIIQLLSFCVYDGALTIFAKFTENNTSPHDTNVIGWFYTGPFNAICSPSAVLVYIFFIRKTRKMDIKKLTNAKANHFQQMSAMWK